jgi:hypothetical protein
MKSPKQTTFDLLDTHRMIPYRYSHKGRPILDRLADGDDEFLNQLAELEGATKDRLIGENGALPGISAIELVSGFELAHIVNASFTYAHPLGGRFNGPTRGAWYAGFDMDTAQAEVSFHRGEELKEINWNAEEVFPYIDYLADFRHQFHDIRTDREFRGCLDPDNYAESQKLAHELLTTGSAGIVYPSVRRSSGFCIACFRAALVQNVRAGAKVNFTFSGGQLTANSIEK